MPNTIKYSTTGDTFSLKKGNLFIGVGDVGKGPSTSTQTYNGVSPVASGYTIYIYNPTQASNVSFYSANNDAELITFTNGLSSSQTNYISNGGNFANGTISPFNTNYSDPGGLGQVVSITNNLPYVGSSSTNGMYLNYNGGRVMSTVGLLTTGVTYTFSFWAKIISGSSFSVSWNNQNGSGDTNAWTSSANLTTSWQRYIQTFTYNTSKNNFYFYSRNADTTRAAIFTEFQVTTGSTYGGPGLQNATECLRWYSIQTNYVCANMDYEPIVTNGLLVNVDAGYTPSYPKTGTTLYGLSMNGNNCTLANGPTYTSINGGGVVFDGVDDTYSIPNVSMGTSALTIDCWFKYQNSSIYLPTICGAGDLWSGDGQTGWGFGQQGSNYVFKMLKTGSSQNISLVTVTNGMIYNFVGTRSISGTQQILKGYLNGKYINQSVGNSIYDLSTSLYPGSYDPTTIRPKVYSYSTPPPATLYGIKVYTRDLSDGEILQNYQATLTRLLGGNIVTNGLSFYLDAGYAGSYISGTTWYDVSGYANNGTLTNGPTYSSSNGGTIVVDGTDDYVIKSSPSNLSNLEGNFTIEAFIKPTSSSYGNIVVLANSSYNLECQFVFTPSKVLVTKYGGSILVTSTDNSVSLNNWYQVIYSQENNVGKIYINGALNVTSNVVPQIATTSNILLGTYNNVNSPQPFGGSYGIVRIYNRALSLTEITQNYNAQKSRYGL